MLDILKIKEKKLTLLFCQFIVSFFIIILFTACIDFNKKSTEIFSDFESGSIGTIEQNNDYEWTISLKNDNDEDSLPDPFDLRDDVPPEIQSLNTTIRDLMNSVAPFTMALNLHSSNSEPDTAAFFYPHFGAESMGYSNSESALWESQISFIEHVAAYYNNRVEPVPARGGSSFASKFYPESWWWKNFQHNVMAITLETVYGRGGFAPSWITPNDLRALGHAVGFAIMAFHDIPVKQFIRTSPGLLNRSILRYPHLYPPKAKDEMKE